MRQPLGGRHSLPGRVRELMPGAAGLSRIADAVPHEEQSVE
ncbi:hypothetical protein ABZX62_21080 [Streptomyces flavidovirens]|uniref:Uncharacterized protein n=1 Tax=Streptomyces flavidovirens TaxID=67298 RepID=A0ABW6RHB5_9ACTN